jgi:hypothetical protein
MRAREFLHEDAAVTSSDSVATIAMPLITLSRQGGSSKSGKYSNDPDTQQDQSKRTSHAVRQFKNSIGH